jgi:hypothetical protein
VLTIGTWLDGIGLTPPIMECPAWPPDLFAITGTLIRRSGAYLRVFKQRDPVTHVKGIVEVAQRWRQEIDNITAADVNPEDLQKLRAPEVVAGWASLIAAKERPLSAIDDDPGLADQLIRLTLIADEASRGIGITADNPTKPVPLPSKFLSLADLALVENELRSFCWDVPPETLCVLGKQHTPVKGATFRSLSHHLALYYPGEIEARWFTAIPTQLDPDPPPRGLNLLLLPWPTRVETQDFEEVPFGGKRADESPPPGYFRYHPKEVDDPATFERKVKAALDKAGQHGGPIDALVFPELALNKLQYKVAERLAFEARCILICGVRQDSPTDGAWDSNECVLQTAGAVRGAAVAADEEEDLLSNLRLNQAKHHRWYLDRDQIVAYQLAGGLPVSRGAWEHIDLPDRLLHFVTLNPITWAVLICEDLARQEPAAELIRAVGPNLLIALLMDGPQLTNRWPARYAAVLAEDPGTSVLTLTSLGMAERSRPIIQSGLRAPASRVIALWRDAIEGEIQIALDPEHDACVLSLEYQKRTEYCADGRSDHGQTWYPVYAGYRSFKTGA